MGDTCSLLGNNYPMLYILYMLYKQSEIFKAKCLVDAVTRAKGGGWDQASPLLGPPRLRLGVLGRVNIPLSSQTKPGDGSGHSAGAKPATPWVLFLMQRRKEATWQATAATLHLPPGGKAQDRAQLCLSEPLSKAAWHRPPAPLLSCPGWKPFGHHPAQHL